MEDKDKKEKQDDKLDLSSKEKEALDELEKELIEALEQETKNIDNPLVIFFNMSLHKNFFFHTILMLLTNILSLMAIIGITGFGEVTNIAYFFIGIILFTVIEMIFKISILSFFSNVVIKSFGAINLFYLIPLYYFIVVKIGKINFTYFWHNIIVCISFLILRLFITYYIKKISFRR